MPFAPLILESVGRVGAAAASAESTFFLWSGQAEQSRAYGVVQAILQHELLFLLPPAPNLHPWYRRVLSRQRKSTGKRDDATANSGNGLFACSGHGLSN